jgi:hypothetical protein
VTIDEVTIVIPLYNKSDYIQRALQSVLQQTYPHWQAIVVDDGSTDDGAERVRQCQDARIQLIQQENSGPGAARNRGLAASKTPLIAFLDADDEWLPAFIERGVTTLAEHPDCAMWVSGQRRGKAGTPWAAIVKTPGTWQLTAELPTDQLKPSLDILHSGAIVARRQPLADLGGFYDAPGCTYGEDIYLWLQVILAHPIYRTPEPLAWYHLEASEIGVWQRRQLPVWPMVLQPQPLRDRCPPIARPQLERYLSYYAVLAARRLAGAGRGAEAGQLLQQYPQARQFSLEYSKAQWEIAIAPFPKLQKWTKAAQTQLRRWRRS